MARRGFDPVPLIIVGGATWLGLNGNLGPGLQKAFASLFQTFWSCKTEASASIKEYKARNPNAEAQMWAWKGQRIARFEDPKDWEAFRQHLVAINAPDPGPTPWKEFC